LRAADIEGLGITVVRESNEELLCLCPFHSDTKPSMSINVEKGVWICFAGCGSGSIRGLAERLKVQLKESSPAEVKETKKKDYTRLWDKRVLAFNDKSVYQYLKSRFIADESIYRFNLSACDGYLIFPVTSIGGQHVGMLLQKVDDGHKVGKAISPFENKSLHLYGLYETKDVFGSPDPTVIVEGPIDAIRVAQAGFRVGALMGSTLSLTQAALCDFPCLFLDYDEAGYKGTCSAINTFLSLGVFPTVVNYEGCAVGTDPGSLNEERIWELIKNRESIDFRM